MTNHSISEQAKKIMRLDIVRIQNTRQEDLPVAGDAEDWSIRDLLKILYHASGDHMKTCDDERSKERVDRARRRVLEILSIIDGIEKSYDQGTTTESKKEKP